MAALVGVAGESQPPRRTAPTVGTPGNQRRRKSPDGAGGVRKVRDAGWVIRKDGKQVWRGAMWQGRVLVEGRRRVVYGTREAEALQKLDALRAEAAKGALVTPHQLSIAGLLQLWLADCRVRGLRPKSLAGYEQCSRLYLVPSLGAVKVRTLRPEHVRLALASLANRGIAPSTVRKVRVILHAALQLAVRAELVGRNVADTVKPPRLARAELSPPTPAETVCFLATAEANGDPLLAFFVLAVYTGCRPGELLALKWADVAWEAGRLHIRRNLTHVQGKRPALAEPKTSRGRRVLTLPPEPLATLRLHRARQAQDRLVLGPDYDDSDLVFCTRTGVPLLPRNVVRSFKRLLTRAGLRTTIRLYDLRHANATAMLVAGVHPKVASERLGHAGVTLFMDTYSHLLPELETGAATALQDVFRKVRAGAPAG